MMDMRAVRNLLISFALNMPAMIKSTGINVHELDQPCVISRIRHFMSYTRLPSSDKIPVLRQ
jgi:hypothetical protein